MDCTKSQQIISSLLLAILAVACGEAASSPYASEVVSFTPGSGAGYGADRFPDVVLGAPGGSGLSVGSTDVLSLGQGGEIVVSWSGQCIVDGPGIDFVVFENAFWPAGDPARVFAELAEVAVSQDGKTWHTFPCDTAQRNPFDRGCAGWRPTADFDTVSMRPLDPNASGGDGFDLADLGLSTMRFVRIRDRSTIEPAGISSGFDLDAVGAVSIRDAP